MIKTISKILTPLQVYFSGKLSINKFIPGIAWFFVLLILLFLPGKDLPETNDWLNKIYFDKWVHAGLFGFLAFLLMSPVYASELLLKKKILFVLIIAFSVSIWGLTTEFLQNALIEGRSFDIGDWIADTFGAIIAIFPAKRFFLNNQQPFQGS